MSWTEEDERQAEENAYNYQQLLAALAIRDAARRNVKVEEWLKPKKPKQVNKPDKDQSKDKRKMAKASRKRNRK